MGSFAQDITALNRELRPNSRGEADGNALYAALERLIKVASRRNHIIPTQPAGTAWTIAAGVFSIHLSEDLEIDATEDTQWRFTVHGAPSGGTAAFDILSGANSIFGATKPTISDGQRIDNGLHVWSDSVLAAGKLPKGRYTLSVTAVNGATGLTIHAKGQAGQD